MIKPTYSHFEPYEELGSFWTPDEKYKFVGKLTYTPENGIYLEFMYEGLLWEDEAKYEYLHGILKSGKQCTLFAYLDLNNSSFSIGTTEISHRKNEVDVAILGLHITPEDTFTKFSLNLTNFQEFCYPQNSKEYAPIWREPAHITNISDFEQISISQWVNLGRFPYNSEDMSHLFWSRDEKINAEINKEITDKLFPIFEKYPREIFLKKDISWFLKFESTNEFSSFEMLKKVETLQHFFSLLLFKPIFPITINLIVSDSQGMQHDIPVLMSFFDMNAGKIERINRIKRNFDLPIALNKIDNFPDILKKWFEKYESFKSFADYINNKSNKIHTHELHARIVLHLTQIESIAGLLKKSKGLDKHDGKYLFPLNELDKSGIRNFFKHIFEKENFAEGLSDLRAEIVHVGKKPVTLDKLGNRNLIKIGLCLELIITSYIYQELGIAEELIQQYQERHYGMYEI